MSEKPVKTPHFTQTILNATLSIKRQFIDRPQGLQVRLQDATN
jgi:hypothetical protein